MTTPLLASRSEVEALKARVDGLEQLVGLLVRVGDPAAVQLDREDRKALVRAAAAERAKH